MTKKLNDIKTTTTSVIFSWPEDEPKPKAGSIELVDFLSKDVGWAKAVVTGPDSVIKPGDDILLSRRVVSFDFEIDGKPLGNTSDNSCLAYKHNGELHATGKTLLYSWIEEKEEVSPSGIILIKKDSTKELEPRKALVHAAGELTGVKKGDIVLLAFKSDAYKINIDGIEMMNAGCEEIICYWSPSVQ